MKQSKTKFVILGLLSEQPMSGYEIKRYIDIRFQFFWNESYGQIYPALKRLMKDGSLEPLTSGGAASRDKTVYQITPSGRSSLVEWLMSPVETETIRMELLLKMYFSSNIDSSVMIGHIEQFQVQHNTDKQILGMFHKELTKIKEIDNHADILRVIDFGLKANQAYLAWCEETIDYLQTRSTL